MLAFPALAFAQEETAGTPMATEFLVHNLWIMLAGMLVFGMHLGFATLESGLTRSKNIVNILFKNSMIICIAGFNLMYPGDFRFLALGEEGGRALAI